jgi:tetratricopeptide (TPR) repeat protein
MRFADSLLRYCLIAALCLAVSACASLGLPQVGGQPADAAPPPPQKEAEPAVSPAVQRAFDEARRSLKGGHPAEAERAFKALVGSNPELGGPHANLGIIYRQAGKLAESAAELEQAVRASPKQPLYFNELGITYRQAGKFDKAREAYEQAIALDPGYAAAQLNLGILYDLYLWNSARALEFYDRYLALSPGGDDKVKKWVADIKNRSQQHGMVSKQEK